MRNKNLRSRDSEATRCAALDAAQRLFAEKGFAGVSMREIASVSGISQSLIYYHFGNKEGLYSAVKERLMQEGLRSVLPLPPDGSPDAPAHPAVCIRTAYNLISGNEDLTRLIAWSHLEREETPWPGEEEFTRKMAGHIQCHLAGIQSGKNFDPLVSTIMIEALILFWSQYSRYYAALFKEPLATITDRYLDQIADLFFSGIHAQKTEE